MFVRYSKPLGIVLAGAMAVAIAAASYDYLFSPESVSTSELYEEGLESLAKRDFAGVRERIRQLDSQQDDPGYGGLLQANFFLRTGDPGSALRTLGGLDARGPLRLKILEFTGQALYEARQLWDARDVLTTLVNEQPDHVNGHRWLGSAYYDLGAQYEAVFHLEQVARLAPDDYRPHWLMGVIYRDLESYGESVQHLQRAWELKPPAGVQETVAVFLSRSLRAEHKYDVALQYLTQCAETPDVLVERASCEFSLGKSDDAFQSLSRSTVPDDDESGTAWYLLFGEILEGQNKMQEALARYEEGVRRFPFEEDLQYRIAIVLQSMGMKDRAAEEMKVWEQRNALKNHLIELNKVAAKELDNAAVRRQLADVCRQMQRPKHAEMWDAAALACEQRQAGKQPPTTDSPR
jgi:tetratricopeptide (TPR) repeat protein